jgi:chorismate dehydratase
VNPSQAGTSRNVNAIPLIYALGERTDLTVENPARVVALFEQGQLDVGLLPTIDICRHEGWEVLADCGAIVSDGPTPGAVVFTNKPWDQVKRIALDPHGRSSGALLQVLCANVLAEGREIEFVPGASTGKTIPDGFDAAHVVGERALTWPGYNIEAETYEAEEGEELIDLGAAWELWTGLPFVYFAWTTRRLREIDEWHDRLVEAAQAGLGMLGEIGKFVHNELDGVATPEWFEKCLAGRVVSELDDRAIKGLVRFANEAAALKLASVRDTQVLYFRHREVDPESHDETPRDGIGVREGLHGAFKVVHGDGKRGDALYRARQAFFRTKNRACLDWLKRGIDRGTLPAGDPQVALLRGRANLLLRRLGAARENLRIAARYRETQATANYLLAQLYAKDKRFDAAVRCIGRMPLAGERAVDQTHADALLAVTLDRLGMSRAAEALRNDAESRGIASSDLMYFRAVSLEHARQWDESAQYLGETINVDPRNGTAYFDLARLFAMHGNGLKADEIAAYGAEFVPEAVDLHILRGDVRFSERKWAEAETFYGSALALEPTSEQAAQTQFRIGICAYRQGNRDEAIARLEQMTTRFAKHPWAARAAHLIERLRADEGPLQARDRTVLDNVPLPQGAVMCEEQHELAALLMYHRLDPLIALAGISGAGGGSEGATTPAALMRYAAEYDVGAYLLRIDRDLAGKLIDNRLPFLIGIEHGVTTRALLVSGYDRRLDTLVAADGTSTTPVDIPWPEIERRSAPTGAWCMLLLPNSRRNQTKRLELATHPVFAELVAAETALADGDAAAAQQAVDGALTAAKDNDDFAEPIGKLAAEVKLTASEFGAARQICEQLLEKRPGAYWAQRYRGDALLLADHPADALAALLRARATFRDDPELWRILGIAYEYCGRPVRAAHCLRRAFRLRPSAATAEHLAGLTAQRRPLEAAAWWLVVRELDPDHEHAAAAVADLHGSVSEPESDEDRVIADYLTRILAATAAETEGEDIAVDDDLDLVDDDFGPEDEGEAEGDGDADADDDRHPEPSDGDTDVLDEPGALTADVEIGDPDDDEPLGDEDDDPLNGEVSDAPAGPADLLGGGDDAVESDDDEQTRRDDGDGAT